MTDGQARRRGETDELQKLCQELAELKSKRKVEVKSTASENKVKLNQEVEKTQRALTAESVPSTQSHSARTARTGHHRHVHITGLRDTMDHSRSELDPQKAFSEQISRIQTYLFPVDDEKAAWLRLTGSNGRHTLQLVPNELSSQDSRLALSFCLGESKRAREGVEDSFVCGTVGPQEGLSGTPESRVACNLCGCL